MKYFLPLVFFLAACSDLVQERAIDNPPKGESIDYCEVFNWYYDGRCDVNCAKPDPDCGAKPIACEVPPTKFEKEDSACNPANFRCDIGTQYLQDECGKCGCVGESLGCTLNPGADYVRSVEECKYIDFACVDGGEYFADDCGCGCIFEPNQCDYEVPNKIWFSEDPEVCAQENLRSSCPQGFDYFDDECGCGCAPATNCRRDEDCPHGYCEHQTDDGVSMCMFNDCGDGSQLSCHIVGPTCPVGQVASIEEGCWGPCVSARTCQYVCESDLECDEADLGDACVVPNCTLELDGVCEKFCR